MYIWWFVYLPWECGQLENSGRGCKRASLTVPWWCSLRPLFVSPLQPLTLCLGSGPHLLFLGLPIPTTSRPVCCKSSLFTIYIWPCFSSTWDLPETPHSLEENIWETLQSAACLFNITSASLLPCRWGKCPSHTPSCCSLLWLCNCCHLLPFASASFG